MQRALLLDVVVSQRAAVLQLLARKNQALLVRRNACGARKKVLAKAQQDLVVMLLQPYPTKQGLTLIFGTKNVYK